MSRKEESAAKVVPAHLDYLTIFNPSLGATDETERDQIVFYHAATQEKIIDEPKGDAEAFNRQLRQIGLAQGLVHVARGFADGSSVDTVETEKQRLVLFEIEPGWWILAAINLTALPSVRKQSQEAGSSGLSVEYSSREVCPSALLIQQLRSAHDVFLLHHGTDLQSIHKKARPNRFREMLNNFWTQFADNWDVLLHGNPALDMYRGLKLAAGGELGVGVGEEEWGSGERDVLEGLTKGIEGLVDLMAFRFGDEEPASSSASHWIGNHEEPRPEDGAIFTGTGALSVFSQTTLAHWVRSIYRFGDAAYGIKTNPTSARRSERPRGIESREDSKQSVASQADQESPKISPKQQPSPPPLEQMRSFAPSIPPPIVSAAEESLRLASAAAEASQKSSEEKNSKFESQDRDTTSADPSATSFGSGISNPDNWVKVFTLGYGSKWHRRNRASEDAKEAKNSTADAGSPSDSTEPQDGRMQPTSSTPVPRQTRQQKEANGWYLIGLKGDLSADRTPEKDENGDDREWDERLTLRTMHVEVKDTNQAQNGPDKSVQSDGLAKSVLSGDATFSLKRLRMVVYARRPFIFILLFDRQAASPTLPSFFRVLHHNLAPLFKPLLASTAPENVASRLASSLSSRNSAATRQSPIFDLVFNPANRHIHSSLPNIPLPGETSLDGQKRQPWTRVEALTVHSQILATWIDTRKATTDRERQAKTGRNWWVVWMRISTAQVASSSSYQEAVLVRRAGDHLSPRKTSDRLSSSPFGFDMSRFMRGGGSGGAVTAESSEASGANNNGAVAASGSTAQGAGWGVGRFADVLGIDAKRYVESLLSLNR